MLKYKKKQWCESIADDKLCDDRTIGEKDWNTISLKSVEVLSGWAFQYNRDGIPTSYDSIRSVVQLKTEINVRSVT